MQLISIYIEKDIIRQWHKWHLSSLKACGMRGTGQTNGAIEAACIESWSVSEEIHYYLLLCLYAGTAPRFSTPAIHWFIPLRMEKAHPLSTAHIVPIQEGPLLENIFLSNNKKLKNLIGDLPLCTNHRAESFRAFKSVGKVDPATVFACQLGLLLFFCEKGNKKNAWHTTNWYFLWMRL